MKEILADARKNGYAVPAFDCVEDVMVRAVLETCQELRSPVVIMCLVGADLDGSGWAYVPGLVRAVADFHDIPIALHLDHATELDSIQKAVDAGFTSVMIDGSMHPFAKNVEITRATTQIAQPRGISVEGELGWVGGFDLQARSTGRPVLTEAKEVERFVEMTGLDALAISIGTSHGVYESLPNLDIERLKELNEVSTVPLVLHGGSGTPSDQIQEAVKNGICKMNVYADNRIAMTRGLKISAESHTRPDPPVQELLGPLKDEIAKVVKEKIDLLLSAGRV